MAQNQSNTTDDVKLSERVPMHDRNSSLCMVLACCFTVWPSRRLRDILTNNMGKCQTLFSTVEK